MLLTTAVLAVLGIGLATAGVWVLKVKHTTYSDWIIIAWLLWIAAAIAIFFAILNPAIVYGGRAYGRVECRNWGRQTERPVRFVVLTSWDSGSCLTRDDHGKWISKDQLRQFAMGR